MCLKAEFNADRSIETGHFSPYCVRKYKPPWIKGGFCNAHNIYSGDVKIVTLFYSFFDVQPKTTKKRNDLYAATVMYTDVIIYNVCK